MSPAHHGDKHRAPYARESRMSVRCVQYPEHVDRADPRSVQDLTNFGYIKSEISRPNQLESAYAAK